MKNEYMKEFVIKFAHIYKKNMDEEGWEIRIRYSDKFIVRPKHVFGNLYIDIKKQETDFIIAMNNARDYGLVIDSNGYIQEYDESKHIRYKHLLSGSELGLL